MTGRRFQHLLASIGILRHPCDLDLLLFFHGHPHSLLTRERLAAFVGHDLNQVDRSLDLLTAAGLLNRSHNTTHAARLYVLHTSGTGWLTSLIHIASTREGRQTLVDAMKEASASEGSGDQSSQTDAVAPTPRLPKVS